MPRLVIDARSVVARRSGIGNYVEALVAEVAPRARDLDLLLLRHPDAVGALASGANVRERSVAGETKSVATLTRVGSALGTESFDLYHAPAEIVPLGLASPYVVTIHDLMWIEERELASAFWPVRVANAAWYTWNIRRAVAGARRVIAISQATADALAQHFPEARHKTRVVHHGVDHQRFAPERAGARGELDAVVAPGLRYSLIVGQGSPYKNHAGMIRAFVEAHRDDPDHRLVLVRRFARVDREMRELLARPDVQARVISASFVSDRVLLGLYRYAEALLFASHYEGFGLPALEAMAMGTPVLASDAAAVREVTGDGALHARSRDHADLVEKMRALRDPALRAQLQQRGPQRAREFTWQRAAEQTIAVYREALAEH